MMCLASFLAALNIGAAKTVLIDCGDPHSNIIGWSEPISLPGRVLGFDRANEALWVSRDSDIESVRLRTLKVNPKKWKPRDLPETEDIYVEISCNETGGSVLMAGFVDQQVNSLAMLKRSSGRIVPLTTIAKLKSLHAGKLQSLEPSLDSSFVSPNGQQVAFCVEGSRVAEEESGRHEEQTWVVSVTDGKARFVGIGRPCGFLGDDRLVVLDIIGRGEQAFLRTIGLTTGKPLTKRGNFYAATTSGGTLWIVIGGLTRPRFDQYVGTVRVASIWIKQARYADVSARFLIISVLGRQPSKPIRRT